MKEVIDTGMPNSRFTLTGPGPKAVRMAWGHQVGGVKEREVKQQVPLVVRLLGLVFLCLYWTVF